MALIQAGEEPLGSKSGQDLEQFDGLQSEVPEKEAFWADPIVQEIGELLFFQSYMSIDRIVSIPINP